MKINELLIAQYNSLRQEILDLHSQNEKIYSNTILIVGATWSTLLTIIFSTKLTFIPGSIFLIPAIYLVSSISKYITNDNRIANISSFVGISYGKYFKRKLNWESRIGEFARSGEFDLNSRFSNLFVYSFLVILSFILSLSVSIGYSFQEEFNTVSLLDLITTVTLGFLLVFLFYFLKSGRIKFGERKQILDDIWKSL